MVELLTGSLLAAFGAFMIFALIIFLAIYLYMAFALMTIANKTKTKNSWLAFIPIANIYLMTQIAGLSGWWTLAVLAGIIPVIGSIAVLAAMAYFWWLIAEKLKRPNWWGILMIIPIVNLVIIGILAWGKK